MALAVKLIGAFILALSMLFVARPEWVRKMIVFLKPGKRIYWKGGLRLVAGAVLLAGSPQTSQPTIVIMLGSIFLMSGALFFVLGPGKIRSLLTWWEDCSPLALRLFSLMSAVVGALLIYCG